MTAVIKPPLDITLTMAPSLEQMKIWWAAFQQDPVRHVVYTDFMPTELDVFLHAMAQGDITVWLFSLANQSPPCVAGGFYLHHPGTDSEGPYAWLGTYVLKPYRRWTLQAWAHVRLACEHQGLCRLFVAARQKNRPVQLLLRHAGFTRLGVYPDWSYFGGELDAVVLYTLRPEDRTLAWAAATQRAQQSRHPADPFQATFRNPQVDLWRDGRTY